MQLDRQHPAARALEGGRHGAVTGTEVDDDVTGPHG
jgi:hypothetical protein